MIDEPGSWGMPPPDQKEVPAPQPMLVHETHVTVELNERAMREMFGAIIDAYNQEAQRVGANDAKSAAVQKSLALVREQIENHAAAHGRRCLVVYK